MSVYNMSVNWKKELFFWYQMNTQARLHHKGHSSRHKNINISVTPNFWTILYRMFRPQCAHPSSFSGVNRAASIIRVIITEINYVKQCCPWKWLGVTFHIKSGLHQQHLNSSSSRWTGNSSCFFFSAALFLSPFGFVWQWQWTRLSPGGETSSICDRLAAEIKLHLR